MVGSGREEGGGGRPEGAGTHAALSLLPPSASHLVPSEEGADARVRSVRGCVIVDRDLDLARVVLRGARRERLLEPRHRVVARDDHRNQRKRRISTTVPPLSMDRFAPRAVALLQLPSRILALCTLARKQRPALACAARPTVPRRGWLAADVAGLGSCGGHAARRGTHGKGGRHEQKRRWTGPCHHRVSRPPQGLQSMSRP
ncbi:hypothetical protein T484DRAFT_1943658 [Baffinella frigidus]|nr:hypothetical protein T484DRAFT_1943658 [Cryptophyta sp. CCMP2293]